MSEHESFVGGGGNDSVDVWGLGGAATTAAQKRLVQQTFARLDAEDEATTLPQRDPDSIKLFVGQVPRSMGEAELRPMFEEIGEIYNLDIIRDKATAAHRGTCSAFAAFAQIIWQLTRLHTIVLGCAFVTYCTRAAANVAIEKFHGKKLLPPVSHRASQDN
jgi:RNA recognition motif-containing protein